MKNTPSFYCLALDSGSLQPEIQFLLSTQCEAPKRCDGAILVSLLQE